MNKNYRFIDLFCGIGGFHYAMKIASKTNKDNVKCVFSSEIDPSCQVSYETNFGAKPSGDITKIDAKSIPDHDILLAGFPCQPFSIIGDLKGFNDTRGTLFFDIVRILFEKRPQAFVLENVKLLVGHNKGKTMKKIMGTLKELNYNVSFKVLNAIDFGLPQKRERVFIVGFKNYLNFEWPKKNIKMKSLDEILEENVAKKYYASEKIKNKRLALKDKPNETTIWHENIAGNIGIYPYSCALRAGASYNYLLINGERRLTEREMLRLQGFPEEFRIVCNYTQTRKQVGNSLPVPVASSVLTNLLSALNNENVYTQCIIDKQIYLLEKEDNNYGTPQIKKRRKIRTALST
jgi:DNA (cytosine-5)-methyltransferase 1